MNKRVLYLGWFDVIAIAATILMFSLIAWPLGTILYQVLFSEGSFSAANLVRMLSDAHLLTALTNTAAVVAEAGGLSLVIGSLLAWVNERTDARLGWASDIVPIVPLLVPPIAGAMGWVFLFAPKAGYLNVALRALLEPDNQLTGQGPLNIYSMAGIVFVTTLFLVPLVYLTTSAALRNLTSELEEASRVSGAGPWRTFIRIALPSIRPAIAASTVLIVISGVGLFTVPLVIGTQARVDVLSTLIYRSVYQAFPPRLDEAVVLSSVMLLTVQLSVLGEYLFTRSRHYAAIGGRTQARTTTRLGPLRWLARGLLLLYLAVATILPTVGLSIASLQPFWSPIIGWEKLSFASYQAVFSDTELWRRAFTNSTGLAAAAATASMIMAAVVVFYLERVHGLLGRLINAVMVLPAGLPQLVIGIGFLLTFGYPAFGLRDTFVPLLLAYLVLLSPQASRAAGSALSQIGRELWEASLLSGASQLRTFIRIVMPLMLAGLLAGWVIVFVLTFREVNASVFLSATRTPVIGPQLLNLWNIGGSFPQTAAVALAITVFNALIVMATLAFARISFNARVG